MSGEDRLRLRCFLALPYSLKFEQVKAAVRKGAHKAGFRIVSLDDRPQMSLPVQEIIAGEMARADCLVADLTGRNPNVFFEIGLAQAMGKALFLLARSDELNNIPFDLRGYQYFLYEPNSNGLAILADKLAQALNEYRHSPRRAGPFLGVRYRTPFFVEWERLDQSDSENLCRELLTQMGYQRIDWGKEHPLIDLIAELPRKDPDGFEYRELWFVSMGRHYPPEFLLEEASMQGDFFLHRLMRDSKRMDRLLSRESWSIPFTLLIILLKDERSTEELDKYRTRFEHQGKRMPGSTLRIRVWDRNYLTSLVQQFPQIGYKYFSDEGISRLKSRKSYEELYKENVEITNRQAALIAALEDEKNRRVRAERDAIWKDISFSAAHKIGNPIFAIETYLDPLQKRITEHRSEDAVGVLNKLRVSVEKAKGIIDQFKSLSRAQKIAPVLTLLRPMLEDVCRAPQDQGVICEIDCPPDITIQADPDRLAECFDELLLNAIHWFDKPDKKIQIQVTQPAPQPLPESVDSSRQYILIHFKDNGVGVSLENKSKIFDAFFTTRDHGTGLGLALVRRIIEGHGGGILETGLPGQGADFEIYLPTSGKAAENLPVPAKQERKKRKKVT